jgi:hypothetical protein
VSVMPYAARQSLLRNELDAAISVIRGRFLQNGVPHSTSENPGEITARWENGPKRVEVSVRSSGAGVPSLIWTREEDGKRFTCSDSDGLAHIRWLWN